MKLWTFVENTWARVCGHSVKADNQKTFDTRLWQTIKKWTWHSWAVHSSCTIEEFYSKTFNEIIHQNLKSKKTLLGQTRAQNAHVCAGCDTQSVVVIMQVSIVATVSKENSPTRPLVLLSAHFLCRPLRSFS